MSTRAAFAIEDVADEVVGSHGVDLEDLEPYTTLLVRTQHSLYRIVVLRGTTVLAHGGQRFVDGAICRINGSRLGGSVLKLAWIGVGWRMELVAGGRCIVTSPVREITTEPSAAALDIRPGEHIGY